MLDLSNIWPEWKAVELIGEGSFGKVYKCVREEYGMKFESAVKVISIPTSRAELDGVRLEGLSENEVRSYFNDIVVDFANEIKLMFMLKGAANIVSVENYKIVERRDEVGWDIYILMEYLQSFASYSLDKKFSEYEVKEFALDIINALIICSKYKVIHRDIKPANIFIDRFGSFKLGDFGVARQLENSVSMMSKKGTYNYMAPEVFRGEKYDFRADVYSLGMVMYKLLNRNKDPFISQNSTYVTYRERIEAVERRRRGEKLPAPIDASPEMAAVILRACEFRPEDRFENLAQFKNAVSAINAVYAEPTEEMHTVKTPEHFETDATQMVPVHTLTEEPTVMMDDFGGEPTQRAPYRSPFMAGDEPTVFADDEPTVMAPQGDEPTENIGKKTKTKSKKEKPVKKKKAKAEKNKKEKTPRESYLSASKPLKEVNLYYFVIGILLVLFSLVSFRSTYYFVNTSLYFANFIYSLLYDICLIFWFVSVSLRKKLLSLVVSLITFWMFTFTRLCDLAICFRRFWGNNFYYISRHPFYYFLDFDGWIPYQIWIAMPLLIILTALSIAVYVKHTKAEKDGKLINYYPHGVKSEKGLVAGKIISIFVFLLPIVYNTLAPSVLLIYVLPAIVVLAGILTAIFVRRTKS